MGLKYENLQQGQGHRLKKIFFSVGTFNKPQKLSAKFSQNDAIISHENIFLTENVPIFVVH